jgi:hypothetical protein
MVGELTERSRSPAPTVEELVLQMTQGRLELSSRRCRPWRAGQNRARLLGPKNQQQRRLNKRRLRKQGSSTLPAYLAL